MAHCCDTAGALIEERGLPANLDAERTILGSILLENSCFYECAGLEGCFMLSAHQRVFKRMGEIMSAGRPVDIVTLSEELVRNKELERIGGVAWLASLTEGLPRRLNIGEYVRIVRDKWTARELISACTDGITRAADQSESASDVVTALDSRLLGITASAEDERSLKDHNEAAYSELLAIREGRTRPGVYFNMRQLDSITGGLRACKLYIVGGRASMGKTSLMIQAAIQHCSQRLRTRLVSLEMQPEELLQRMYAVITGIPYGRITAPEYLKTDEWNDVQIARRLVDEWPLEIDSRPGLTVDAALAGCRLSCRRRNTRFVALDYLQILRFTGQSKLRYMEISDAAAKLREFAKTEGIPVMALSSITEAGDRDPNQRPTLGNLRQSGDLQFHADVAILVHRQRGEDGAEILTDGELIVAKQRGGQTGVAYVTYNTNTLLFEDRGYNNAAVA